MIHGQGEIKGVSVVTLEDSKCPDFKNNPS